MSCNGECKARFPNEKGNTTAANKLELELAPMICPTPSVEEIRS